MTTPTSPSAGVARVLEVLRRHVSDCATRLAFLRQEIADREAFDYWGELAEIEGWHREANEAIRTVEALAEAARDCLDTELGGMVCIGSYSPAEHALGKLAAALSALGGAAPAKEGMVLVPAAKLEQVEARANALCATLHALAQHLGIDYEQAQNAPGKPSDVFMEAARKHFTATPAAPKGGEGSELSDWPQFRERRIALFKLWSGVPLEEVEKARNAYLASEQPATPTAPKGGTGLPLDWDGPFQQMGSRAIADVVDSGSDKPADREPQGGNA